MTRSRALAPAVYFAEQRLNALLALEAREAAVAQIAAASDCAPSTVYLRKRKVLHALEPRRPGPRHGHRDLVRRAEAAERRALELQQQLDALRLERDRARSRATRTNGS